MGTRWTRHSLLSSVWPRGMTLIELILVMALLATVLALSAPSLSKFFAGRRSTEEARRLLALTRYARSEAIARSEQLELWLDPEEKTYGLRAQLDTENDGKLPMEYQMEKGLDLDIASSPLDDQGQASAHFLPDGTLDEESIASIIIRESADREITLQQTDAGIGYEIR